MDELEKVLGYAPSDELRRMILRHAKEKNIPVLEAASAYGMPEMMILNSDGMAEVDGELMTPEEFKKQHPHRRLVVIR